MTLQQELEITVENALLAAGLHTPASILAERLFDSEPALMDSLKRPWLIERLVWIICRKRRTVRNANQLVLPGFENLPRRLTMEDGTRTPLLRASLKELKRFRVVLNQRRDPRVAKLDELIALVLRQKKPGISVGEAMAAEQAKLNPNWDQTSSGSIPCPWCGELVISEAPEARAHLEQCPKYPKAKEKKS